MWCNKFFISNGDRFIKCSDASSPVQINVRDSSVAITYNTETIQHKQPRLVPTYMKSSGDGNIFWPKFENVLMLPLCHMLVRASSFLDATAPMKIVGTQATRKRIFLFYYACLSVAETGSNKWERWLQSALEQRTFFKKFNSGKQHCLWCQPVSPEQIKFTACTYSKNISQHLSVL